MIVRNAITYSSQLLTLVLMWMMVSVAMPLQAEGVASKVLVNVHNTRNPMPANALAYLDQPGRFVIVTLTNTTDVAQQGHFDLELTGPLGTLDFGTIHIHPDQSSGSVYANVNVRPMGTVVLSGQNLNQLFQRCSANDVYSTGALGDALTNARLGSNYLIPEGRYSLTLRMIDDSGEELGAGSCEFDVCYTATPPTIISNDTYLKDLIERRGSSDLTATDKQNLAILDSIVPDNVILEDYLFFQFPVNMPYRFQWTKSDLNLTYYAGVRPSFYYDFELIEVLPSCTSFEDALTMGTVLYRQRNLATDFVDIPFTVKEDIRDRVKALGRNYLLLARVKAVPVGGAQDVYSDDVIVQNGGYSQIAVVVVADFVTDSGNPDKDEDGDDDDAPSVDVKILPIKNGLPVQPSDFFLNPGAYISLEIKSGNKEDIDAVLLPALKGEKDWCVMPGAPAQSEYKDRTFTIDGKGHGKDAVTTTLAGAELTRVMGGYDWSDILYYFEDQEKYGAGPKKKDDKYPEGEKSVWVQVFKAKEDAETIDEMEKMGEAEETFEVKRAAGADRNVTVEIKLKPNVMLPDDAKLYFTEPENYLDMTVTNAGEEAADVLVRLGLNQYGVSRDLTTVNIAAGSSKTFSTKEEWAPWRVTGTDDAKLRDEIEESHGARDTIHSRVPTLPLKLRDQNKKNAMRAALYVQTEVQVLVADSTATNSGGSSGSGNSSNSTSSSSSNSSSSTSNGSGNSSSSNSSSNSNSSNTGSGSSGNNTAPQTRTETRIIWCDTDSCLFVPYDLTGKTVKLTVKAKDNVEFPNDPMAYLQDPASYFTMKVKRVDSDTVPELKKFAVQMLFPHPTEEGKWLTAVIKNKDCSVPNGKDEYTLEDTQLNNVAGKHTTDQLRSTDTLKYWTQKPVNLKEGETEILFRLCHVENDGSITKQAFASLTVNVKDLKKAVSVKIEKRASGGAELKALSVDEYLRHPEKYFDVSAKRLMPEDQTVGMMLTIDNKWTSIYPLTLGSSEMLKLTTDEEKTLTEEEVKKFLHAEKDFYIYTSEQRMGWKASNLKEATDSLSMGEHKVMISLYSMPRVKAWNANTPNLVDSVRTLAIASDSMNFTLKQNSSVGVIVTVKNPKKAVTDHVDRIYKDPSEYFSVTLYNKLAAEQTVRLAMAIDSTYTSVEPLLSTDAIKLPARPAKPGLVRNDSIELTSEQVNILLKSVKKEHFRKWTNYAGNEWESIDKPEDARLASDSANSIHKLQVMAYLYAPGQEDKDYGTTEGCKSMKDTLGMAEVKFTTKVDSTVTKAACADQIPEITDPKAAEFGGLPATGQTMSVKRKKPDGTSGTWTMKAAGFEVTLDSIVINSKGELKGNGKFKWKTKGGEFEIACEFDGVKVNVAGECVEGEVTSTKATKSQISSFADAIPYDWFEESALAGSRDEYIKRMKEAQGADNKMSDYYRYTKSGLMPVLGRKSHYGEGVTLPAAVPVDMIASSKGGAVALGLLPVDVAILNVSLGPDHAWMNLVGTLTLPEVNTNQSKNIIMFGAPHICMQNGPTATLLPPDGAMAMMTDYEIELPTTDVTLSLIAPADWSDVMGGCYFGWKDGGFDVVTVKAGVTIPQLKAVDEKYEKTGKNARAEVAFTFRDKENWGFGLSLDAFQLEDLEDFTFTPTGGEVGIYFDHSSQETPKGVAFPDSYDFTKVGFSENVGESGKASKENTAPWKGLYIQQVEVRMPDWFSKTDSTAQESNRGLTFGVKDVLIDKSGVTVSGYAADLGRYEMDSWKISLDTVAFNIVQKNFDNFHLTGSFRAPIFNADLGFRAGISQFTHPQTKQKGAEIDFKIQQKDSMTFDIRIADIDFQKNNSYFQVGFNTVTKKAALEIILGGKISFKSLDPNVRIKMKDIKFAGMRLATFPKTQSSMYQSLVAQQGEEKVSNGAESEQAVPNKKQQKVYFDIGRFTLASPQKALGPFCISLEDVNLKVDSSKPETRLGVKLGISASICDVFAAGGGFTIWGKVPEEGGLQYDCVSLDKLSAATKISKLSIAGEITAGDDGNIKHGFSAKLNIGTPMFALDVEGGYGQKDKTEEELEMDHQVGIAYPDSVYAWGYFYTRFESEALAKLQPFSLKGIQGGFYFNCNTEKTPRYRTFGMLVGAQCTIGGDAGVQGDAKVSMVYDLANKRCSNMLIDINAKALGGTTDVNGQIVYANPNDSTEYFDLLVTVDVENNADAMASKLFGADVHELTDKLNKANQTFSDSISTAGATATNDLFKSFHPTDSIRSASQTSLQEALGQKNNYGEGEHASGRDVRDSTQLVKMQIHVPFNLHVDIAANPKKWHIYFGEPDYSKRCEVTFIDFAAGGKTIGMSAKVYANAYICMGNELPNDGALPDLPADIQAALFDNNSGNSVGGGWKEQTPDSTIAQAHNLFLERADMARQFGTDGGIMLGMEAGGKVSVNAAIYYVDVAVHAGLDVTMEKLTEGSHCANSDGYAGGVGGFYANGQVFALLQGEIGAIVNLFYFKGRVPVIKASSAGVMQFGGPNPSWFYGTMRHQVTLLGGLVQFSLTSTTKAGKVCIPDHGNPIDEIKIFDEMSPGAPDPDNGWGEKTKPVSPYVIPAFTTVMPMGRSYTLVDENSAELKASENDERSGEKYSSNSLREYRFVLGENKANDYSLYLAQYLNDSVRYRAVTVKTEDHTHFTVDCGGPLIQGQKYALNVKAYAQEYCFRNGSSMKSWGNPIMRDEESGYKPVEREWSQELTYFFRTDSFAIDNLPEEVIALARPGNGNTPYKNNTIYRDEARCPYLSLTAKEPWERLCLDNTVMYGKLSYSKKRASNGENYVSYCQDSLEMELFTVDGDIYLVRPKGSFQVDDWSGPFTYVIERVSTVDNHIDTLYVCPFTVYEYDNFTAEVKALSQPKNNNGSRNGTKEQIKVSDFPSLEGKGVGTLLNITQKWTHNGATIDALNATISDESIYHDRHYANGSNAPQHLMLANPYLYMAYWSNFGLIGSQAVTSSHPYFDVPIDNTYMELRLNTPEYRNEANYAGHLQAFPNMSGGMSAAEARNSLKPSMYKRMHEGRQWGYESGQAWPAIHDTLTSMVTNDALLAEQMLGSIRGIMSGYYKQTSHDVKKLTHIVSVNGMAECQDAVDATIGGGRFAYRFYQAILPFAVTTAYGLSLGDVQKLGYGTGRSDDGTEITDNMAEIVDVEFMSPSTNWSKFPLAAACNFGSSSASDNYQFDAQRYINSIDKYSYRLYRVDGYHTTRGRSCYTVTNAGIQSNAYDIEVDAATGDLSGRDATADPVVDVQNIYISDLVVSVHSDRTKAQKALTDQGYKLLPYNLNSGTKKGDAVYIGYKETYDEALAITNVMVRVEDRDRPSAASFIYYNRTYERVNFLGDNYGNLNSGAGGKILYLYQTRDDIDGNKLTNLDVLLKSQKHTDEDKSLVYSLQWDGLKHDFQAYYNADLNTGAGGDYIYLKLDYNQRAVIIAKAQEMAVISDLMVVAAKDGNVAKRLLEQQGKTSTGEKKAYTIITKDNSPVNFNQGAGGLNVYVGYCTSNSTYDAITGVAIYKGNSFPSGGFSLNGATYKPVAYMGSEQGNLNAGNKGSKLYLCYTRDGNTKSGEALTGLSTILGNNRDVADYEDVKCWDGNNLWGPVDLNEGAKGSYIYLKAVYKGFVADGNIPDEYTAAAPQYPYQLAVAGSNDVAEAQLKLLEQGYTLVNADLNGANKGQRIFMGYKTTTSPKNAIKQIIIRRDGKDSEEAKTRNIDGSNFVRATNLGNSVTAYGNLNSGVSGSNYIYLYSTTDLLESGQYVKGISVIDSNHSLSGGSEYATYFNVDGISSNLADLDVKTYSNHFIYLKQDFGKANEAILPERYITDIMVAGGGKEEAQASLMKAGFKVWCVNINEKSGVQHPVYIGYKDTATPSDSCITGIMLFRRKKNMNEIGFTYRGKYYEHAQYQENMSEHGTLKPNGMGTEGVNYYLCVTRSNEPDGKTRQLVTNRARVHTSKGSGTYAGSYNPEEDAVVENFNLKAGGYGISSYIYTPTVTKPAIAGAGAPPSPHIENSWPFWTEVAVAGDLKADNAKKALTSKGFQPYGCDLNKGGAVNTYLGYKRSSASGGWDGYAIEDITIYRRSKEWKGKVQYINGELWYRATTCSGSGDLNQGRTGTYLYLVYKKTPAASAQRALVGMESVQGAGDKAHVNFATNIEDKGILPRIGDTNNGKGNPTYLQPIYRTYSETSVPTSVRSSSKVEYISEVAVAVRWYADDAKRELTSRGYTVLDVDLCSSDYEAYMGYKTTTNPDRALTNLVFASTKDDLSFIRFKLDNHIYTRCPDFGGHGGNLRKGNTGVNYYLCYTRDSNGKDHPLTTQTLVLNMENTLNDENAVREVSLEGFPQLKDNRAIINNTDKTYILMAKDETKNVKERHAVWQPTTEKYYVINLMTNSAVKESDAWKDNSFVQFCKGSNGKDGRIKVDMNKGGLQNVYLGCALSTDCQDPFPGDIVIYRGKIDKKEYWPVIAGKKWRKAFISRGYGNTNEGRGVGDHLQILYSYSTNYENCLRFGGIQVIQSDSRQYDYRFAEYLDSNGNRFPNADLNKGASGPYIYLRCEYDKK